MIIKSSFEFAFLIFYLFDKKCRNAILYIYIIILFRRVYQ